MKTVAIVVAILIILLVVVLVVLAARRNRRRAVLRERFGPEYDVAVRRGKDRRAVEQRLEVLAERRDSLEIRDVALQEHERFAQQWADVQGRFVDDPGQAVADADGVVNAVLRSRGYPVESFDDRIALVATDHQDIVERYRSAHETYAEHLRTGSGETEQLRQAFLDYREVFGRLNRPAPTRDDDRALSSGDERRAVEATPSTSTTTSEAAAAGASAPASAGTAPAPASTPSPAPAVAAEPVPAEAPTRPPAEPVPSERPAAVTAEPVPPDHVAREGAGPRPVVVNTPARVPPAVPATAASAPLDRPDEAPPPAESADADAGHVAAVRLDEAEARERRAAPPGADRP